MPESQSPKFRRRSEARPDEILDAALSEFLKNGYGRTTMTPMGFTVHVFGTGPIGPIAARAGYRPGPVGRG